MEVAIAKIQSELEEIVKRKEGKLYAHQWTEYDIEMLGERWAVPMASKITLRHIWTSMAGTPFSYPFPKYASHQVTMKVYDYGANCYRNGDARGRSLWLRLLRLGHRPPRREEFAPCPPMCQRHQVTVR